MFIVMIRTAILYTLVILVMRLMGKRQIGELQPYEFVITIMISDLAALPMQDTRLPLILGIIPIITLLFIKTLLTQLQLKSQLTRRIIEGEPTILICRGKVNFNELKRQQINLDELMEELRLAGYFNITDVDFGILENNGQMSFLSAKDTTHGSISEISQQPPPKLPIIYVLDGEVNRNALTTSGKTRDWIEKRLQIHQIDSIEDVVFAMTDTTGKFIYQLRGDYSERCKK